MPARRALALVLLAGCRQIFGFEEPVVGTDALPPELDGDRDGVEDGVDNCPDDANSDQADEDADLLGDVCDPCPPFRGNADPDQDGVGVDCDPNPSTPGDVLVAFEAFNQVPAPAWQGVGTVAIDLGDLVVEAGDAQTSGIVMTSPTTNRIEIRALSTLTRINAVDDQLGAIGLVDRLAPGTDEGVVCQMAGLANGGQEEIRIFNSATGTIVNNAGYAFAPGTTTEMRHRRIGDLVNCRNDGPQLLAIESAVMRAVPDGQVGIRVRAATARYHWLMVVSSP